MRHPFLPSSAALLALSCFLHATPAHADLYSFTFTAPANAAYAFTALGTFTTDSSGATQNLTSSPAPSKTARSPATSPPWRSR